MPAIATARKANDAEVVKLTGNQTVGGVKDFSSPPKIPRYATTAALPTAGNVGSLAAVTGSGLFWDNGAVWNRVSESGVRVEDHRTAGGTDQTAFAAAMAAASAAKVPLLIDPKVYELDYQAATAQFLDIPLIIAFGATLKQCRVHLQSGNQVWLGGTTDQGTGTNTGNTFLVRGPNTWVQGVVAKPARPGGQNTFAVQSVGATPVTDVWLVQCEGVGGNDGFDLFSGDGIHVIDCKQSGATDDGLAVKSRESTSLTRNIDVRGFHAVDCGTMFAIGDQNFLGINNIRLEGIADNCGRLVSLRPGLAEGLPGGTANCSSVVVEALGRDANGTKMKSPILLKPGGGGTFQNVAIKARVEGRFVDNINNYLAVLTATDVNTTMRGIDIDLSYFDPWGGVANGVSGAPGHPAREITTAGNLGTIRDITLDLTIDGYPDTPVLVLTADGTLGEFVIRRDIIRRRLDTTQLLYQDLSTAGKIIGGDTGWILPALATDITLNNATYSHLGIRREGKRVWLVLALTIANPIANKTVFTLPKNFRQGSGEIQLIADSGTGLRIRASDGLVRTVGASGSCFIARAFVLD